jgi:hypothetical protein
MCERESERKARGRKPAAGLVEICSVYLKDLSIGSVRFPKYRCRSYLSERGKTHCAF